MKSPIPLILLTIGTCAYASGGPTGQVDGLKKSPSPTLTVRLEPAVAKDKNWILADVYIYNSTSSPTTVKFGGCPLRLAVLQGSRQINELTQGPVCSTELNIYVIKANSTVRVQRGVQIAKKDTLAPGSYIIKGAFDIIQDTGADKSLHFIKYWRK